MRQWSLVLVSVPGVFASRAAPQTPDGSAVFTKSCQSCHDGAPTSRAPAPEQLKARSPESIVDSLTGGAMRYQGRARPGNVLLAFGVD